MLWHLLVGLIPRGLLGVQSREGLHARGVASVRPFIGVFQRDSSPPLTAPTAPDGATSCGVGLSPAFPHCTEDRQILTHPYVTTAPPTVLCSIGRASAGRWAG